MKLLILLNGLAGSGKDTFVTACSTQLDAVGFNWCNLHRSDYAKSVLKRMGWNEEKTPDVRQLLADMVAFGEKTGFNTKQLYRYVDIIPVEVIFYHVRSPQAIEKITEHYKFNNDVQTISVLLRRKLNTFAQNDVWGVDIENYPYTEIIENSGTLGNLHKKAEEFVNKYIKNGGFTK